MSIPSASAAPVPAGRDDVLATLRQGQGAVVWSIEAADLLTPVAAYMRLSRLAGASDTAPPRNAFLLESVEGGVARGRYSVIGLLPDLIWRCHGGAATINTDAARDPAAFVPAGVPPLDSLRAVIRASQMTLPSGLPPMVAGLFGYLGYDMVRQMEHLPDMPADDLDLPEGVMIRPGLFAIFDTVRDELILAAPVRPRSDRTPEAAWQAAQDLLATARRTLSEPLQLHEITPDYTGPLEAPRSTFTREGFCAMVRRIQDYIAAGDAFQVVPSQRFSTAFTLPPLALYRALRRINPAPFLFNLAFDGFSLVGSSPEILVRLRDGQMTVRPLAGTRPRGRTDEEDLALERDLLADPKELAEH